MSQAYPSQAYGSADPGADVVFENVPFDDLQPGQSASLTRTLGQRDIELFAAASGDFNPTHLDPSFQAGQGVVGHSLWGGALISAVLATRLPGLGTDYVGQSLRFRGPLSVGDTLTARVTVREKRPDTRIVVMECRCFNQDGDDVVTGIAEVIAPVDKRAGRRVAPVQLQVLRNDGQEALLRLCDGLPALPTAVVHPCDAQSLKGATDAAVARLIDPVLVGPESRIRMAAEAAGIDLAPYEMVDVEHSHAAAAQAVALARSGQVKALMKGSLHTDEIMGAVVDKTKGLRTERRISHVFVMSVPTYPKPLLITDAAINIAPDLEAKVSICQNAIDMAQALGVATPKVAVLAAFDTLKPKVDSTLEAAILCKMAERGQITGGVLDGPLTFDLAVSEEMAQRWGRPSPVAGRADVLVVPDLESGNMVAKQLAYVANAEGAGVVLGARVPIILTSRADDARTRFASCAVSALYVHAKSPLR